MSRYGDGPSLLPDGPFPSQRFLPPRVFISTARCSVPTSGWRYPSHPIHPTYRSQSSAIPTKKFYAEPYQLRQTVQTKADYLRTSETNQGKPRLSFTKNI